MRCIREQRFFLLYFLAEERDGFPAKSERMFLTQKRCLSEPFFVFTLNGCQKESAAAAAAAAAAALYAKQAVRRRIEERRREGRDRPQFSQGKAEKPEKKGDMSFVPLLSFFFSWGPVRKREERSSILHMHTRAFILSQSFPSEKERERVSLG